MLIACALFGLLSGWVIYNGNFRQPSIKAVNDVRSIAVLPFKQIDAGQGSEHFGVGMADALITRLINLRRLVVRSTNDVLKYQDQKTEPLAAGRELKVDAVLEGSIQHAGERVQVTVRLISVDDGKLLWAEKFDAPSAHVFTIQDQISEQMARALAVKITDAEQQQLTKRYTENIEAYRLYTLGQHFSSKRTKEAMYKGIEYLEMAVEVDPNYALAYARLASTYNVLSGFTGLKPREARPKAEAAALKALELDDSLAEAHIALAGIKYRFDWDWAGAEKEMKRAIELNPNLYSAYALYAQYLVGMGRFDESFAAYERALEINSVAAGGLAMYGFARYCARQYDKSIALSEQAVELDPNHVMPQTQLCLVYERVGRYDEAVKVYQKLLSLRGYGPEIIASFDEAYKSGGYEGFCRKRLEFNLERERRKLIEANDVARDYLTLGDKEGAIRWLEKAYEERETKLFWLKVGPDYDSLRSDPRFIDLLRRVGFEPD